MAPSRGMGRYPRQATWSLGMDCSTEAGSGAPLDRRRAVQVGLDRRGAGAEARAVDLQVLHDAQDVVARLGERDALDPVDGIDLGIARTAVLRHPLLDPA